MIVFSRRTFGLRSVVLDGIYYGIIEVEVGDVTTCWLGARVSGENIRLGKPWPKVVDSDDEGRARELIAAQHQSLLSHVDAPVAAA